MNHHKFCWVLIAVCKNMNVCECALYSKERSICKLLTIRNVADISIGGGVNVHARSPPLSNSVHSLGTLDVAGVGMI